ncbi:MAG: hypothetical protein IPM71_05290 [Bacteroidota bacterium]|nr:MAG: hypothetical protein IPM71_05290 [Bacteroidota bacterium]
MKNIILIFSVILLPITLALANQNGEEQDSLKTYKNTIRLNISNPALFGGKNYVLGYERVLNSHQSFSVNAGTLNLPKFSLTGDSSIVLHDEVKDKGFSIALDYRFYLASENKYQAPRGIYLGPYYAFHYYTRYNHWTIPGSSGDMEVSTDTRLIMNFIGVQLGYQFVIRNRFTVDMVLMGPGRWFYNVQPTISTNLSTEDEALLLDKLYDQLIETLPGGNYLIDDNQITIKNNVSSSSFGFRYLINVGYRF